MFVFAQTLTFVMDITDELYVNLVFLLCVLMLLLIATSLFRKSFVFFLPFCYSLDFYIVARICRNWPIKIPGPILLSTYIKKTNQKNEHFKMFVTRTRLVRI